MSKSVEKQTPLTECVLNTIRLMFNAEVEASYPDTPENDRIPKLESFRDVLKRDDSIAYSWHTLHTPNFRLNNNDPDGRRFNDAVIGVRESVRELIQQKGK